jgi:hypothetical protein
LDKKKTKKKISHSRRHLIQALGAVVFNGNFKGFISGSIYTGNLKTICVPVLNCYSCPGALGACPIGSLQAIAGSAKFNFSFYVFGLIALFGILLGRFFCGYLCPFGLLQDLLHKIPTPKIKVPAKLNRILSFGKYVMLIGVVMLLPFIARNSFGMSDPYFCKYVCPVGTIGGGIPLVEHFDYHVIRDYGKIDRTVIAVADITRPGLQLAGHFKHFGPDRMQLIGNMEMAYLKTLTPEEESECLSRLFATGIPCLILSRRHEPSEVMLCCADKYEIPILQSDHSTSSIYSSLVKHLNVELAPHISMHGVLVEVLGEGVLILARAASVSPRPRLSSSNAGIA